MKYTVRKIQEDDLEKTMRWRMAPDVTRYMPTDPIIHMEHQLAWLDWVRSDITIDKWIIEVDEVPVGIISIEDINFETQTCTWGYYIGEKEYRRLKLAISLEMSLYDYIFGFLGLKTIRCEVLSFNKGVISLHLGCGAKIAKVVENQVEKHGEYYDVVQMQITAKEWFELRSQKKYEHIDFRDSQTNINIGKVHHIGVATDDLNASITEYRNMGYLQITNIVCDNCRNVRIVFLEHIESNITIELIEPMNEESPVSNMLREKRNSTLPYHICYAVESIDNAIFRLREKHFVKVDECAPAIALNNRKVIFMFNKKVGLIELLEEK